MVPFAGSMNLHIPLDNVVNGKFTKGLEVETHIFATKSSSYVKTTMTQDQLTAAVTADVATNTIHWSYPYDKNKTSLQTTQSLIYEGHQSADTALNDFFFRFTVPVTNVPVKTVSFTVCSCGSPNAASNNCTMVKKIVFFWHCLASDTQVTLANGDTVALSDCDNSMRVVTGSDSPDLGIEATTRAPHVTNDPAHPHDGIFQLTTEGGRQLTGTAKHPVSTPSGLVILSDLKPGDEVFTIDGPDRVAACEPTQHDGLFMNLKLIDQDDRDNGVSETTIGTFVANGIVVGDLNAMTNTHQNNLHSPEYMLPRLDARYHRDYHSTLDAVRKAWADFE